MSKSDDFSPEHLQWLVYSRSDNQNATLRLYSVIKRHEKIFANNIYLQSLAQELAAVAFSLWRAVFLSDLSGNEQNRMIDVDAFLQSLIAHNTISYVTDYRSREWTFPYYIKNARFRLAEICQNAPTLLSEQDLPQAPDTEKEEWTATQTALTRAVERFEQVVESGDKIPG
jgi:hypothetical protein